jgi:CheY-like chemotaxis protein
MTRILLVEDDVDLRLIMEHVLIDGGYRSIPRALSRAAANCLVVGSMIS